MLQNIDPREKFSSKDVEEEFHTFNKSYLNIISDIKSSKHRQNALQVFMTHENAKTPSEISKILGIGVSHTCKILNDLKDHKLIICINEQDKRNKKHEISELGKNIGNILIK